jgi:hypothetical protein
MARELYQLPSTGSIVGAGGGWGQYQDSVYTEPSRQTILADVLTPYTVDGLGPTTNTTYLRSVPATIWNGTKLPPAEVGAAYSLRLDFSCAPTGALDGVMEFQLDIGSGSQIIIVQRRLDLNKGQGIIHNFSFGFPIFCLATFFANGGTFFITPDIAVEVWNRQIFIQRTFSP